MTKVKGIIISIINIFVITIMIQINLIAQETFTSGRISITVEDLGDGARVNNIQDNGTETLNTSTLSEFFTLFLTNTNTATDYIISSGSGWGDVTITNNGADGIIDFSNPNDANLPSSLLVNVTINTDDAKSSWDITVSGLGVDFTLMDAVFPKLNIKADGNDTFLYPLYSGRLTHNPGSGIDYFDDSNDNTDNSVGSYPRGWGTTMQFMAYYNSSYGLYIGYHDPDASIKFFGVKNENNGVKIECKYPTPNKTIPNNTWDLPGVFELDLFDGNWYEAAIIYKNWVSSTASYWAQESPARTTRQHNIGDIGVWLTTYISETSMPLAETYIQQAVNFFDVPVGMHSYEWNDVDFDHFYPDYFPESTGFPGLVSNIQNNNDAVIMPYTNGRMWDTGVGGNDPGDPAAVIYFNNDGLASATKRSDNSIYTQTFRNNVFAVMCPTQIDWQDVMVDVEDQITRTDRIGAKAIYMDMVAASGAAECMDPSHNHTLGGGSFWRDGYKNMLSSIHSTTPDDVFITAEGGCDFIADEVDAFMIQGWTTDNQVPAWQAIYTGKVQLFGTQTGGSQYGNQQFYAKLGQGYIFGVQTGRQFIWLAVNPNSTPKKSMASNYVRRLSRMRYKLRDFVSYGEMKKPIELSGEIPDLTYTIFDWGGHKSYVDVTYPAVQNSVWQNGDSVVISFINATLPDVVNVIDDSLSFSFSFNGSDYGLTGHLAITEINETSEGATFFVDNSFDQDVTIRSITPKAYLIRPASDLGNTYYVSTSGNDANSGTSEAQAWRTITYAASIGSPVVAGDVVNIKAGDYGNEHVAFEVSGTQELPILFEGYQNVPGDSPDLNHTFGAPLNASIMPLLNGNDRATGGTSITLYSRQYLTIKNIQITAYEAAIDGWNASYINLDNIIATTLGNTASSYSGKGISFSPNGSGDGGDYNKLNNCFIENAAAEGISIVGDFNELNNCSVYCNENTDNAAMDYYIVFEGNNNLTSHCHAERIGNLDHDGHGISFKGDCEFNKVMDCTAINLGSGFGVRHRGAKFNTFENCKSYDLFGFEVRDGASDNIFRNCEAINTLSAVIFYDTGEDGGAQYTGRNNTFENCIFRNTTDNVIDYFYYEVESVCDNNTFANCVIDGADYLFNCDRSNLDNKLFNCIITNVTNYSRTATNQAINYPLNVIIENSNFHNNGFAPPAGTNITSFDPLYVDINNNDYHLQGTSLCINAGNTDNAPNIDKEGAFRPLSKEADLGVYEYGIYWTGFKGNRWRNNGNWSNNTIPTAVDSVTIPPAAYYYNRPEAFLNSQVKTLYIYGNGEMVIKSNVDFGVND